MTDPAAGADAAAVTRTASMPRKADGSSARGLARYAPRLARWPIVAAGIAGCWLLVLWRSGEVTDVDTALWLVRGVAAVAAVSVVFALDDPSVDTTRALPGARRSLMGMRFTVSAVAAIAAMLPAAVVLVEYVNTWSVTVGVALEVCGVFALTMSAALVLQRQFGITEPAQFVVLVVVALFMVAQIVGQRWPLLVPAGPQWAEAHWRWAVLLSIGVLIVAWQLRDPASRPVRRALRR